MKNKFFVFGMLIALFALSLPLYADPGGAAVVSVSTANLSADVAMVETQSAAFDSIATTEAVKTVAGFAVLILGAFLLIDAFMPAVFRYRLAVENDAEALREKRTKSRLLKSQAA